MRALILYAVPLGALGDQVAAYFDGVDTEAQRYPPHCTLTGFFHDDDVDRYVDAGAAVAAPAYVSVSALQTTPDWIGLELGSPDLLALGARFADTVAAPGTRQDEVRLKHSLHVSLAYGHDATSHSELARRAVETVDCTAAATWELRLYARLGDGAWVARGAWPLS